MAVGAHIGRRAYIPAGDSARILDAVSLLHGMEDGAPPMLGRRVAVYGGGNTAMDAARTARRLGATEAVVVYRRTRDRMPAHDIEVSEALDEGVTMRWLSTISRADEGKLLIEKMQLDETGFPQPTGEFEELEADSLVLALGQNADLSVLENVPGVTFSDNVAEVGPDLMTGHPGIFAGGDMVPVRADRHGRHRPRQEGGAQHRRLAAQAAATPRRPQHELAGFGGLNTWYYADAPATVRPTLEAARRVTTFDEVVERPRRVDRAVRGAPLHVLRELLRLRQLLRRLPRQRHRQARRRPVRDRLRLLQGLRPLRRRMPLRRHRHGRRGNLSRGLRQARNTRTFWSHAAMAMGPDWATRRTARIASGVRGRWPVAVKTWRQPVTVLDLARWQFGITTVYHFLFVPLTIGLAFLVAVFADRLVPHRRREWLRLTKFFGKLFLINFAMGVVTGIVQEFQFGMNWCDYSPLRRRHLRRAAGDRGAARLLPRVDVPRPVDLRLGPPAEAACTWRRSGSPPSARCCRRTSSSPRTRGCSTRSATLSTRSPSRAELTDFVAVLTRPRRWSTFPHTIAAAS